MLKKVPRFSIAIVQYSFIQNCNAWANLVPFNASPFIIKQLRVIQLLLTTLMKDLYVPITMHHIP